MNEHPVIATFHREPDIQVISCVLVPCLPEFDEFVTRKMRNRFMPKKPVKSRATSTSRKLFKKISTSQVCEVTRLQLESKWPPAAYVRSAEAMRFLTHPGYLKCVGVGKYVRDGVAIESSDELGNVQTLRCED